MKRSLVLILWVFTGFTVLSQTPQYKFRKIDISNGLSNNQVRTFYHDDYGFMWIGTISGLNRYDGYSFKVFKNVPGDTTSLAKNEITRICKDNNGYLWLISYNGLNCIFNPVDETFSTDNELLHKNIAVETNNLNNLLTDRNGNIWMVNTREGIYFYNVNSDQIKRLVHIEQDNTSISSNAITSMVFDKDGFIWAINQLGCIEKIDPVSLKVIDRLYFEMRSNFDEQPNSELYIDEDNDLWVYSNNRAEGVFYYSRETSKFYHFSNDSKDLTLSSNIVTGVVQDAQGDIWVSTDHGGINRINKKSFQTTFIQYNRNDPFSLAQNSVTTLYKDKIGTIWVGTFKSGACFYHPDQFKFTLITHDPDNPKSLPDNDINCFAEDNKNNLWIGTNGNGLIYYNRLTNTYTQFKHKANDNGSLSNDIIVCMMYDHENKLWIGTYYGGLNIYDGKRFKHFRHIPDDPKSIADDRIWQLLEDSENRLWIGTLGGGLDMYDRNTGRFLHYRSGAINSIHSDFIMALAEDQNKNIWIGSSYGIDMLDTQSGRFIQYIHNPNDTNSLCNNGILCIYCDSRGFIWIGTRNGLNCFDPRKRQFRLFTTDNGLPSNNIISIEEDNSGHLWISTHNGLVNMKLSKSIDINQMDYRFFNYDIIDGLQGKEFNEHTGFKTHSGELIFAGANGFNIFDPAKIKPTAINNHIVLTDLKLFNQSVPVNKKFEKSILLKQNIGLTKKIRLKQKQNVFSIEFAALNNLYAERTKYQYMLEGFNKQWIVTGSNQRSATFTNLNAGHYLFRVKATNNNGEWNAEEAQLEIIIVPPFYASRTAFVIYYVVLVVLLFMLIKLIKSREKEKYRQKQEMMEHNRQHEMDAMKIKFLTNVSHEFRTPLSLILAPVEKLLKGNPDTELKNQLVMIQRNGKRLLNLVNQLLDFRKIEVSGVKMNPSYGNIIDFARTTAESFTDLSGSKNIKFSFNSSHDEIYGYFDQDKLEKIIFNLLSNAFRYTHNNGSISISISKINRIDHHIAAFDGKDFIEIRVSDTGIGIEQEMQERIFERFVQSEKAGALTNQGTGIGLAIAQEFIRLHQGTIHVESEPEKGSTFIVRLPIIETINNQLAAEETPHDYELVNPLNETEYHERKVAKVLIVEDNEDLRFYLRDNLSRTYEIIEATDGKSALDEINKSNPDLVVSDVMMPVMDGFELCKRLKNDPQTSHIPIILLTAMSSNEKKMQGLELGADDYITKPFNYEILSIRIKKLIEQRKDFQKNFNQKFEITPGSIGVTSLDEKFMQKALKITEENMANPDYSVERLSRDLGVSRGHLYNKMVALTGKTPIEFIRIMRLKRAAQLLGKSQLSVSEIAYQVGFNDPRYFARYFKDEFNLTPSEYAKKNIENA